MVYFLKAESEDRLVAALLAVGIVSVSNSEETEVDGVPMPAAFITNADYALDVIGTIHKPTGVTLTVDGMEVPEMAPVPGWHANLLAELSDEQCGALADVLLPAPPAQPYRVWAS